MLSFAGLLVLVVLAGALRGPGDNAKHVLLPAAAERAGMTLERASGLYDGVNRAAGLVGAPLAGVLIAGFGLATALFACGAVYFAATLAPLGRTWRGMDRRVATVDTAVP